MNWKYLTIICLSIVLGFYIIAWCEVNTSDYSKCMDNYKTVHQDCMELAEG